MTRLFDRPEFDAAARPFLSAPGRRRSTRALVGASILLSLPTACHRGDDKVAGAQTIACRLPGRPGFEPRCSAERMAGPDGMVVTVRQPDGGFRRLLIVKDGRGVIAADGVDPVAVSAIEKGSIDVAADGVVYRLPATVTP